MVLAGGPPPDGIPAIDEPTFLRARDVNWLADTEAVLALTVGDETRAYPFQIMTWHEIVNDTVGGVPVAVTYCPLCNSGVAFDRRVDGKVLDFVTSGMLHANNLIMYDRQTESLWPQLSGQAAIGVMTGATMDVLPTSPVGWADFRTAHPDAWVLSRDTGHRRDYGRNPYVGLDSDPDRPPPFGAPSDDDRLPPMERVIALQGSSETVTVVRSAVEEAPTTRAASRRRAGVGVGWRAGLRWARHRHGGRLRPGRARHHPVVRCRRSRLRRRADRLDA